MTDCVVCGDVTDGVVLNENVLLSDGGERYCSVCIGDVLLEQLDE